MGFKLTLEIDVDVNPSAIGEALRSSFFDEKMVKSRNGNYRETGCYSAFDWKADVEVLPELPLHTGHNHPPAEVGKPDDYCGACMDLGMTWKRGQKDGIECRWYWDGDGTLAFKLPDGRWLVNTDCKKDHEWFLTEDEEDF